MHTDKPLFEWVRTPHVDEERIRRLEQQEANVPPPLAVRDRATIRLLAAAGLGGTY
jgi:site-specific recombinase XerC